MFDDILEKALSKKKEVVSKKELNEEGKALRTEYSINKQKAENLGQFEMVSGIISGIHHFAKEAGVYFKDLNQVDMCILGDKKTRIYTRDALSDEDMLIAEKDYQKNKDIDIYILCKIKAGKYNYIGYTTKAVVEKTNIVQMIGKDSTQESEKIRRIFAEQYLPISDILPIWEFKKVEEEKIVEQPYVPLHMHSEYSLGDAFGTCSYIASALKKKGFTGAALTDHGTLAGVYSFQKAMLEKELKPIIGAEIYVNIPETDKRFHTIVLVKNEIGWKNLLQMQAEAVREHFYYKPIVQFDALIKYNEGLIITSACMGGIIPFLLSKSQNDLATTYLEKLKKAFKDDFYIEIQGHKILDNLDTMKKLFELANKYKIECVYTTDSHYPYKEDIKYHEAVKAISMKKNYGEAGYDDTCFYLMQEQEIREMLSTNAPWMLEYITTWFSNTKKIMDKCDFQITPTDELDTLPKYFPSQEERKDKLRAMTIEGLEKNTPYKYEGEIKERLDLELNRMLTKNYENYFLIVNDMVNWAKKNKIRVGPGRGSVGASLVAYALNITECDPIKFELLFDRFLSEIRRDAPDVDMDFMDHRRQEVVKYLIKKYGENHAAKVVTYSKFHAKGIIRDVGRIFNISSIEVNRMCSMVIERSGGDARSNFSLVDTFDEFDEADKFRKKYPEAADIACKLEGHIRHRGVHAAALILTDKEIQEYVPIGKVNGEIVTEWEKFQSEEMKLVKFDILGLKTLSVIQEALDTSGCELPTDFEDPKVFEHLKSGNTTGVFQFESTGMTKLVEKVGVKNFAELYDCSALYRPGCLHSGITQLYINRAQGKEACEPLHPLIKDITKKTKGLILYQEQVMKVTTGVGHMSWAAAETVRKVMTKSKGTAAFNRLRSDFVNNAHAKSGLPIEEAERLYDTVSQFGSYGFNEAHSVEYTMLSYYCAWLQVYYPKHFYAALLKFEGEKTQIINYVQAAKRQKIEIEFPEINKSKQSYAIVDGCIYAGFDSIDGIATRTAIKIIQNQPYESFEDFRKKCKLSNKIMRGLIIADAFRNFKINKKVCLNNLDSKSFNAYDKINDDFSDVEYTQLVYENTSLIPKIDIKNTYQFGNHNFIDIVDLNEKQHGHKQVIIRGLVTALVNKDKILRNNLDTHEHVFEKHLYYLNINDGTGNIAAQISPWTYEKYKDLVEGISQKAVTILGTCTADAKKMNVDMLQIAGETDDVDQLYKIDPNVEKVLTSAAPAVSKNGKSYYRIKINDGTEGLCFRASRKLFPGQKIKYTCSKPPFIDVYLQ